jgi:alpha-D-ribose 1-methylphosphonate 5-triphosphate synthase subunit PhnG
MFQSFDSAATSQTDSRAHWIALLSRAPVALMESALASHAASAPVWLRRPETGLMMVQGRAGATGERFNLGEVTVTRCALRLEGTPSPAPHVGVAYVLGRSHKQARLAAIADALLQDPAQHQRIHGELLAPVRQHLATLHAEKHARAQSTKVEFFTVAREVGATTDDAEAE